MIVETEKWVRPTVEFSLAVSGIVSLSLVTTNPPLACGLELTAELCELYYFF